MFRIIILISLAFIASISYAQELMIIGQEKVSVDEFLRIYQKNNQSTTSYSEKDVQEYVELFTLFKMKLQEAKTELAAKQAEVSNAGKSGTVQPVANAPAGK